jgi:hypothetical protein
MSKKKQRPVHDRSVDIHEPFELDHDVRSLLSCAPPADCVSLALDVVHDLACLQQRLARSLAISTVGPCVLLQAVRDLRSLADRVEVGSTLSRETLDRRADDPGLPF